MSDTPSGWMDYLNTNTTPTSFEMSSEAPPPERRPMEFAPAGTRWPWLPLYACEVEAHHHDDGTTLHVVGSVARGRIGLRRWVRQRKQKGGCDE